MGEVSTLHMHCTETFDYAINVDGSARKNCKAGGDRLATTRKKERVDSGGDSVRKLYVERNLYISSYKGFEGKN